METLLTELTSIISMAPELVLETVEFKGQVDSSLTMTPSAPYLCIKYQKTSISYDGSEILRVSNLIQKHI